MNLPWSDKEVELIVESYFAMLTDELNGVKVNKTFHNSALMPLLQNRTRGSVEFKHQNISAVLVELKQPYIKGYKPLKNYQRILFDKVLAYLTTNPGIEKHFELFAETPVLNPKPVSFDKLLTEGPTVSNIISDVTRTYNKPIKVDYLELEQNNRILGLSGEELVVNYERWRLQQAGKDNLADKVEWLSRDKGDGLGYDILSRNNNGTDRYIEVKTTKLGIDTPIFFSKNEYEFSKDYSDQFYLYRVYDFKDAPKAFIKHGDFGSFCNVEAVGFKGMF